MATFVYPSIQIDTSLLAKEAKQDVMIAELQDIEADIEAGNALLTSIDGKVATETTLAALEAKVATEAKQDLIITELQDIEADIEAGNTTLTSIDGKVATETTLAALEAKDFATETTLAALDAKVATETTLAALEAKDFATETTLAALEAKDFATNTTLAAQAADIALLEDRLAGSLVAEEYDYIALTYVTVGFGIGEIETATYRNGGALGPVVATLTLAYDSSDRLASVTRS